MPCFAREQKSTNKGWYDLNDDWSLIESSFASQYGIRLRKEAQEMPWTEFCSLLHGLLPDSPLGNIITIRSEKDPKVIKEFGEDRRRIYNEWKNKSMKELSTNEKALKDSENRLAGLFNSMFGKKE